jgi:transcriptional regulator GlxA family with amidase domain
VLERVEYQYARLLRIAADQEHHDPVARVIRYAREHLSEPLAVADLAKYASLSPSAFTALFRETTGTSPYQFVKEMRLARARPAGPGRGRGRRNLPGRGLPEPLAVH